MCHFCLVVHAILPYLRCVGGEPVHSCSVRDNKCIPIINIDTNVLHSLGDGKINEDLSLLCNEQVAHHGRTALIVLGYVEQILPFASVNKLMKVRACTSRLRAEKRTQETHDARGWMGWKLYWLSYVHLLYTGYHARLYHAV